ncbi:MAG: hypothetical protein HY689_05195 [Chloroflexi bacterium]|nr:hypothetical protein [Chloroflexota bacterium]
MTTPDAPLSSETLQVLARQAGLDLSAQDLAALEPGLRRTLAQAQTLRDLPLTAYEPGVVFAPAPAHKEEGV